MLVINLVERVKIMNINRSNNNEKKRLSDRFPISYVITIVSWWITKETKIDNKKVKIKCIYFWNVTIWRSRGEE